MDCNRDGSFFIIFNEVKPLPDHTPRWSTNGGGLTKRKRDSLLFNNTEEAKRMRAELDETIGVSSVEINLNKPTVLMPRRT